MMLLPAEMETGAAANTDELVPAAMEMPPAGVIELSPVNTDSLPDATELPLPIDTAPDSVSLAVEPNDNRDADKISIDPPPFPAAEDCVFNDMEPLC
jgi:hypothetical protein